ncbi:MAG: thrombospondin type 3 repeat-containing protein [Kofleriaceae bacterium]|jgi:hypothetical protein|nr:thrombospondin type 3 repeat-containing protein [Kofleriaceae bacterium]
MWRRTKVGLALSGVLVLAPACRGVLGLDGADGDEDGDLIEASVDNCPLASNPGQEDGDGDGLGDACDACAGCGDGSFLADARDCGAHDEDGDGLLDLCDPCPIASGAADVDGDGDGVGDGCDANAGAADRILFDPFTRAGGIGWSGAWDLGPDGDSLMATLAAPTLSLGRDLGLGPAWRIELALSAVPVVDGERLELRLSRPGPQGLPRQIGSCTITRSGGSYVVAVEREPGVGRMTTSTATLDLPQRLWLSAPPAGDQLECAFIAAGARSSITTAITDAPNPTLVQVTAGPGVALTSFLFSERAP